ncbi:MAG: MacB family efflux pump subunit [Candidatus Dadabacteria bacterium]|nr:MacB family efflux pump subunit [Candidatus Dadabacteria bacterium]
MTEPIIRLKDIKRYFGSGDATVKALEGISLEIHPGEFVAIMGQSGSGKSTLMNIIGMLDRATGGFYEVSGKDVSKLSPDELAGLRRNTFGFIFQRYNLLSTANAEENVEVPALYAGMEGWKRKERARKLLTELGLGERLDHRPNELSGGQQQRVAVARALMNDPPVILADEPTGALDRKSSEEVMALLRELNRRGRTVIVITHEEEVAGYARRRIRLEDGMVVGDDGPEEIIESASRAAAEGGHGVANLAVETMESVKMALRSLRVNIFRTSLTLLGIIIGVAAVITMLAIGEGSKRDVLESISSLGTNILYVRPGGAGIRSSGDIATLVPDDAKAIDERIDNIVTVVPSRDSRKTLRFGNIDYATTVEGVGAGFPVARDWEIEEGTFFTEADINSYSAVIVVGTTVVETLFPHGEDPIGKFILVGNIPFEIIGVMESKGAAPWGSDQDDTVWVPYTTGLVRIFGSNYLTGITIKVEDVGRIEETETEISELLLARHRTDDFSVRSTAAFLAMATETQNTLTILLGAVAAISLLVGGIGVMNIMLVSVVERTREIGIRMATGARRRDILLQFNTEASVVCTIGGIVGVILGYTTGIVLSFIGVNIAFTPGPTVLAFACAVGTGLLFGYLPARKAAHLDPVVALSSE